MTWISVDDALPEYDQDVLVAGHLGKSVYNQFVAYRSDEGEDGDHWFVQDPQGKRSILYSVVRYWMKLPIPPPLA